MRTIEDIARECGRNANDITLMAVSKTVEFADILRMYHTGQRLFGENRVQEAEAKFTSTALEAMPKLELHCIGTLQRNKVARALKLFHCVQSVDSLQLLMDLAKACAAMPKKTIRTQGIFLQVNPLADAAKYGILEYNELLTTARYAQEHEASFSALRVRGLMTIAPFDKNDALRTQRETEKAFARTRLWKERLETDMRYESPLELSMGMSGDFAYAIREQSTMVRVGTALFGKRL